ncbi:hypothetical protein QQF64_033200 [Cirrhinus molitorella]|uniref:Uncharacterized protein n=1 Tax=Cirrhinus molitorella TaxID=172907 RepID=A0ABR3MT77_9TELE
MIRNGQIHSMCMATPGALPDRGASRHSPKQIQHALSAQDGLLRPDPGRLLPQARLAHVATHCLWQIAAGRGACLAVF